MPSIPGPAFFSPVVFVFDREPNPRSTFLVVCSARRKLGGAPINTGIRLTALGFLLAAFAGVVGCRPVGPRTIPRDRFEYSYSISESWKRQTLLNIVKLRYADTPIFVDVGQIVAGYSLETEVSAAGVASPIDRGDTSLGVGGRSRYTDRPTITYTPLTGNDFVKSLVVPLTPESVFFAIESGWPADAVLGATVTSMNGLRNQEATIMGVTPADPDFLRVRALMRKIQLSGAMGLRVIQGPPKQQATILSLRSQGVSQEILDDAAEVRRLLRLNPDARELKLVFGSMPANDQEVALQTRPLLRIMGMMSAQVDVPAEDIAEGRAAPGVTGGELRIACSPTKPADAFVAVAYRNKWFWIDDRDLRTKRALTFLMLLFTMAETGERQPPPLITVPAQ